MWLPKSVSEELKGRERERDRDTRELIACSSNDREQTVSERTFVQGRIVSHGIYTVRLQSPD